MFTKKHYEAIAGMIERRLNTVPARRSYPADRAICAFISDLEDYLKCDNPEFDRWRFREACGF